MTPKTLGLPAYGINEPKPTAGHFECPLGEKVGILRKIVRQGKALPMASGAGGSASEPSRAGCCMRTVAGERRGAPFLRKAQGVCELLGGAGAPEMVPGIVLDQ